jgi:hypothetical protein
MKTYLLVQSYNPEIHDNDNNVFGVFSSMEEAEIGQEEWLKALKLEPTDLDEFRSQYTILEIDLLGE